MTGRLSYRIMGGFVPAIHALIGLSGDTDGRGNKGGNEDDKMPVSISSFGRTAVVVAGQSPVVR